MKKLLRGQSLVEVTIIMPILLFILIGVIEVGVALRNYYILINASREIARFAVRPGYLDLDADTYEGIGYSNIVEHAGSAVIPLDLVDIDLTISIASVDTGSPCDPSIREDPIILASGTVDYWPNCACDLVNTNPFTNFIILHPNNYSLFRYAYPLSMTFSSKIDYDSLIAQVAENNNIRSCFAAKSGYVYSTKHALVFVELFYKHNQLFGFPAISNSFTDPVILHTMAVMRKIDTR